MSSASDRRKSSGGGDEGGGANWMDTYGDLVTLLLTFFVLLFSFSNIDAEKWKALVGSFTGVSVVGVDVISPQIAVANPIEMIGPVSGGIGDHNNEAEITAPGDTIDPNDPKNGDINSNLYLIYNSLNNYIGREGINAAVEIYEDQYLVRVVFPDAVFFDTADATVKPEAYHLLDQVIDMFLQVQELYTMLSVEGHTDSRPIHTERYESNWDVSVDRAVHVVRYIRNDGRLDTSRLVALGYGEERPVAPNDTPENMALNRRVEFVVESAGRLARIG